jgi:A/G-specific adenine glycosylase
LDPYAIWVSEIMLQQTQVKTVIPYWERWMALFPNIRALARASEVKILKAWEGLGYYSRARNLQKAAKIISREFGGEFPKEHQIILKLPGIGPYTAGAICSIAYNQPEAILDGNVARVLSRIFAVSGPPQASAVRKKLWSLSSQILRDSASRRKKCRAYSHLNQSLMELGALICTPRDPLCPKCPARHLCAAFQKGEVRNFPQKAAPKRFKRRKVYTIIARQGESVLIRQRPASEVNARFWEFPNFEVVNEKSPKARIQKYLGCKVPNLKLWHTIKHTITNNRITLRAYIIDEIRETGDLAAKLNAVWVQMDRLHKIPLTAAHAKLVRLLLDRGLGNQLVHNRPVDVR